MELPQAAVGGGRWCSWDEAGKLITLKEAKDILYYKSL